MLLLHQQLLVELLNEVDLLGPVHLVLERLQNLLNMMCLAEICEYGKGG